MVVRRRPCKAIDLIYHQGRKGETLILAAITNGKHRLIHQLIAITDELLQRPKGTSTQLITFVSDRKGHDLRYAIDASKIKNELGWQPSVQSMKVFAPPLNGISIMKIG